MLGLGFTEVGQAYCFDYIIIQLHQYCFERLEWVVTNNECFKRMDGQTDGQIGLTY